MMIDVGVCDEFLTLDTTTRTRSCMCVCVCVCGCVGV